MDVKMFLNGNIDETIYMVQSKNCVERLKEYGLQTKEIHLWAQIGFPPVVSQIPSTYYLMVLRQMLRMIVYIIILVEVNSSP